MKAKLKIYYANDPFGSKFDYRNCFQLLKKYTLLSKLLPKNMVFGLSPAGTEFCDFTKTSFELQRTRALKKYGSQTLNAWHDF